MALRRELAASIAIPVVLAILFLAPPVAFNVFAALIALAALREFYGLAEKSGYPVAKTVGMLLGVNVLFWGIFAWSFSRETTSGLIVEELRFWAPESGLSSAAWLAWLIGAGLVCAITPLLASVPAASALGGAASTLFGIFVVALPASAILWLRTSGSTESFGPRVVLFLLLSVWFCDSCAYYGGRRLGKRPLAPAVSPNKTWEGSIAGLLGATILGGLLGLLLLPEFGPWRGALAAALVSTAGQVGDLAESLWKRGAGVKDSGIFLPEHGGFYDRIDSLLFAAPVLVGLVSLFPS